MENITTDLESLVKNPIEILRIEHINTEMNNLIDRLNRRLEHQQKG